MQKFLFKTCLIGAASVSFLFASNAHAAVTDAVNLRTEDSELFDLFNGTVNTERLALDEHTLPELFADSLQWDGLASTIDVYFINEGAGYRNQLLYSTNGGEQSMLFNDIASKESILKNNDGPLKLGDGKSISGLSGNVGIDFFLKANGAKNSNGKVYGADAESNADGLQHVVAREFQTDDDNWVLLGFEDLFGVHTSLGGKSDRDFNDTVIAVRGVVGNRTDDPQEVPEPVASVGLLLMGALGLSQTRRRKAETT